MPSHLYPQLALLSLIFVAEYFFPVLDFTVNRFRHYATNITLYAVNTFIIFSLFIGIGAAELRWTHHHSMGLLYLFSAPSWVKLLIAFVLLDYWQYLVHLASHEVPLLWRFHRVHHTDTHIDASTAIRQHLGERVIWVVAQLMAVPLFGLSGTAIGLYAFYVRMAGFFYHSNIALPEKWDKIMRIFIVSPGMHRLHHSSLPEETNSNFSNFFSCWDRICGTYRVRETPIIQYGLNEFQDPQWQTFSGILKTPAARL